LLLSVLLLSCATTATRPSNTEMVRGVYDSFAKGDVPAVLGAFDPSIEWNEAENLPVFAEASPYRGPKAVAEGVFMRIPQYLNDFRVKPEKIIDAGDTVVVLGRYVATGKTTNLPLNAQFVHVWTVSNGKVTRFQQFADTAQFQRVIGVK
jgi:ketosteroid isomerase-like protein